MAQAAVAQSEMTLHEMEELERLLVKFRSSFCLTTIERAAILQIMTSLCALEEEKKSQDAT